MQIRDPLTVSMLEDHSTLVVVDRFPRTGSQDRRVGSAVRIVRPRLGVFIQLEVIAEGRKAIVASSSSVVALYDIPDFIDGNRQLLSLLRLAGYEWIPEGPVVIVAISVGRYRHMIGAGAGTPP